ncbi:protein of unknown function [Burkholderia multivorans]
MTAGWRCRRPPVNRTHFVARAIMNSMLELFAALRHASGNTGARPVARPAGATAHGRPPPRPTPRHAPPRA